jgi:hypothetical protein
VIGHEPAPIFIVGVSRSGTGLLRLMLNAHPRIYLCYEASFFVGSRSRQRLSPSDWLGCYFRTLPFAWLRLNPDDIRSQLPSPLPRERLHEAYSAVMRTMAQRYGRARYGDKTPRHAGHLQQIFDAFPDARVIHIVRDPRNAVSSLTHMPWGPGSYLITTWNYARQIEAVRPFRDRIYEVRLETLLEDPRREMMKVLDFVGERWDETVLDHSRHAPTNDVPSLPWLEGTRRPRGETYPGHRRQLPGAWVRIIERCLRSAMARYGYQDADLDLEPSLPRLFRAGAADLINAIGYLRRAVPYFAQSTRRTPPSPAQMQKRLLGLNPKGWQTYANAEIPDPPSPRNA